MVSVKKLFIFLIVLAIGAAFSVSILAQKAPGILKNSLQRALGREVNIRSVEYHFPWMFELQGFEVMEAKGPFKGDPSLLIDDLTLRISPASFSKKMLVIHRVEVENAKIIMRKWYGHIFQPLMDAWKPGGPEESLTGQTSNNAAKGTTLPLEIRHLKLKNSQFQFLDYDADENGFVVAFDGMQGEVKNIVLPASHQKTSFSVQAAVSQGRHESPARAQFSGWTKFGTKDTEAVFSVKGLHLPYFSPYYRKITQSVVAEGYLDLKSVARIDSRYLSADFGFEFSNLHFESYESENLLFNLKAEEILSFLKDSSGRLKFQVPVRWNMADRSVRFHQVMRKGIEQSLKKTILGNFGHAIENAIQKDDLEGTLKNIKNLFR